MEEIMTINEAVAARHSVRSYESKPVPEEIRSAIEEEVDAANRESGLHIQVLWDKPQVFAGKVKGAENGVILIGKRSAEFEEKLGYFGARIMLKIQMLGLNSVWVAMSFNKKEAAALCSVGEGESVVNALAFGYGTTQGTAHRSKAAERCMSVNGEVPEWFAKGMEAAMLAPTAINQQQFVFSLDGDRVSAKAKIGPYSKVDLGIVKYFFEIGSGKKI